MNNHEKLFLLTDGCMWEANKKAGTFHAHAIEVVDTENGAVRYIKSGSIINFVSGDITETRDQETYNRQTQETAKKMSDDGKNKHDRRGSKEKGKDIREIQSE